MPNIFAFAMIFLWPFIAIILYRKYDLITATFWVIVGGYMFLPVKTAIDLPMIPAIGKNEISAIAALIGCYFIKHEKIYFLGKEKFQKFFILILLIIPIINVFFNLEPMFNGARWMPGLRIYDAISQVLGQYLNLLPFIIAISIVKNIDDLAQIIRLLVIAGLVYSVPILFEIRFSPQLHSTIYGFFPHDFKQQIRFGGFRAVVFMGHGLLVAIFCFVCVTAAAIQLKIGPPRDKMINMLIFCYLFLVLLACKSVGSLILAVMTTISILFLLIPFQKTVIKVVVIIFLLYPTLSILNLIPYKGIVDFIGTYSLEKADSLDFRFDNETEMLEHAYEKFLIGWGGWARNRLDGSVNDGYWLIIYGQYGAIYFYTLFSLFIYPVFRNIKNGITTINKTIFIGFSLILTGVLFDQIPNASLSYSWLWFLAGCLGSCSLLRKSNR